MRSRLELRHRQLSIDEHKRRMILKLPIRRPLHANQLRRQHREPRVAHRHHRLWVGDRIVRRRRGTLTALRHHRRAARPVRRLRPHQPSHRPHPNDQNPNDKPPQRDSHGRPHSYSIGKGTTAPADDQVRRAATCCVVRSLPRSAFVQSITRSRRSARAFRRYHWD